MKVVTVLGTRPEIIRLSRVIPRLDQVCDHRVIHTGQNFDTQLSEVFFEELQVRAPDLHLGARGSLGEQVGQILKGVEDYIRRERPDRFLILGDTNSALSAFIAKRLGVPVFHMEAGNRCFDDRVPEEVNRRMIDQCSDVLMPYTERSRINLLQEGYRSDRIHVVGNPIFEVLESMGARVDDSDILGRLELEAKGFFLVTLHRAENVDIPERLKALLGGLERIGQEYERPVVISTHPRTKEKIGSLSESVQGAWLRFLEPFGFSDFVALEKAAKVVLSDSGTVQEECAIFGVPNVTLRDTTERPETLECASNILAGADPDLMLQGVATALDTSGEWSAPTEYLEKNVSEAVVKIVTSYYRSSYFGCCS